jgi:hypothetical protein
MGQSPDPSWASLRIRHKCLRPVPPWQLQQLGRPVSIPPYHPDGPPWLADLGLRRWYTYLVYPQQQLGCARLSFLDAYSGYDQIKLKKEDEEKTAFITPYDVFCYQVMPFGLKNVGATYQRMMQNCLGSQIGRNIQVYIDDMVITTRKEEALISDLKETFDNLDRYKLKLNPTKCSFGVSAGQLL